MKVRQHVNPLKSDLLEIADVPRIVPPAGGFLEVELGSAEAHFLIERALEAREGLFVGVELRREMIARADRDAATANVSGQVRNVFANVSVDVPRLFGPGSVRRFHINFPDPWFKSRQHKRRVVGPALIADLERALEGAGEIHVMTDIFDIALDAMAALEQRLVNVAGPWSFLPASPFRAKSRRERQCEQEGKKVWRLLYGKAAN